MLHNLNENNPKEDKHECSQATAGLLLGETKLSFLSMLCLAIATALGLVYPHLLKVLIDDAIKLENYGIVPRLALTVLVWSSLKLSCGFARIFGEAGELPGLRATKRLL